MASFDGMEEIGSEQVPIFDRMDKDYRIYVNNLPEELNEDAVRDIFSSYGKITGIFYRPNATWAYITFGTYREAELTIRELNNKKPLYLKVALAKERSDVKEEVQRVDIPEIQEKPNVEPFIVHSVKHIPQSSIGRGYAIRKCFAIPDVVVPGHEETQSSLPISNAYESDESYMNTNRLWTRGVLTVTADGKRHVSFGRGYTMYQIPEPHPRLEEYITKVYELRKNGVYEYADDKLQNKLQRCIVCSAKTTKHCEKCYTYYCSKACQVTHWPRHQAEDLVEESSLMQSDINDPKQNVQTNGKFNDIKLRRPNISVRSPDFSANVQRMNCTDKTNEDAMVTDKFSSIQFNNGNNVSKEQKVEKKKESSQPAVNATSDRTSLSRFNRYNSYENSDQSRENDQSPMTSQHIRQNLHIRSNKNDVTDKTAFNEETNKNYDLKNRCNNNVDRSHPHQRNGFQNDRKASSYNYKETTTNKQGQRVSVSIDMTDEDLDFRKDTYLSKTDFKDVEIIVPLGNNEYWICKIEDMNARNDLTTKLQDVAKNSRNVQPTIGEIYAVLYNTIWHRAMIVSLNPLKVHFIDFGKDETLENNTEIKNIGDLAKVPRFARKIRIQNASAKFKNLLHGNNIFVKMLSMDAEKIMAVEAEERLENLAARTAKASSQSSNMSNERMLRNQKSALNSGKTRLRNILDGFADLLTQNAVPELKVTGVMQIFEHKQKNIYNATLIADCFTNNMERIVRNLPETMLKMKETVSNYKPQVGDLVCSETEKDTWYRGYITMLSPELRVAAVDEARILPVTKVLPYPAEFLDICTCGVVCEVTNTQLNVDDVYNFTGVIREHDKKQGSFKIEIQKDNEIVEVIVKSWEPIIKSIPALAELRNGCKICLTSYRNQYIMFAHSLDESEMEYTSNIMQHVAHCSQTAPPLSKPLSTEQMVIAPYCDGNNYRAMITKIQDNTATIVYVDFGNFRDIDVKELREISNDLGMKRSCSARIVLKDVPRDVPMTTDVDTYLRDLVGREEPLVCTYEDGLFKNGVRLTTSTGEDVNNKIKQLLVPDWKQDNFDDNTCYMLNDIEIAPLGKVGDTVELLVLYGNGDGLVYMMSPSDIDLITHVTDVMPELIKEYCEKVDYYIPRQQELCLALYEEAWYRALCLNPKLSHTTCEIFFIDYGNVEIVEHKDVRLMPKDFIRPAAMANICTVVNLAPVDSTGNYSAAIKQKLSELVTLNTFVKVKIVECVENGEYKIELPEIHAALVEQGLVPSLF
ncbi:RING finger protein 17 [Harpegnathos saltator]|uniref:RING finger protein 17 n=1 Tax=Harpegnathos saltator TaxID=610380 RepID=E2BQX6_HARSA|nr:RING finger protein 17 [Harpegnathos saltator]